MAGVGWWGVTLLDEIAGKITAAGLASSSGANGWMLLKSYLPDSTALQHKCVALMETGGRAPDLPTELDYPSFQVLVRGDVTATSTGAYAAARAEAEAIKLALHGLGGQYLPTSSATDKRWYVEVQAQQEPMPLPFDAQQRPRIVCNYATIRSRT